MSEAYDRITQADPTPRVGPTTRRIRRVRASSSGRRGFEEYSDGYDTAKVHWSVTGEFQSPHAAAEEAKRRLREGKPRAKHTPGPWVAEEEGYEGWSFKGGYNGRIVARDGALVYAGPSSFRSLRGATEAEARANARLIAQAPRMLDTLRAVEWGGQSDLPEGGYGPSCPWCDALKRDGEHAETCELAATLRAATATGVDP